MRKVMRLTEFFLMHTIGGMRKPYFKKNLKCWYVFNNSLGKEVRLDPDEEKAFTMWQHMVDAQAAITPLCTFRRLAGEWTDEHYEDTANFKRVVGHIISFINHLGHKQASKITQREVVEWLREEKPGKLRKDKDGKWVEGAKIRWSPSYQADVCHAIKRVYRWGLNEGHIKRNPVADVKVSQSQPRTSTISSADHKRLLEAADPQFRLYLIASTCGARPKQIRDVQAKDVMHDFSAWVFRTHKTYHKTRKPLIVYLPPCLQTITKILSAARPNGPLFVNSSGYPWKKDTVGQKLKRLKKRLGLNEDFTIYSYRHTFATNALLNDVSLPVVSELLGHTDTRMVSKVYGHLDQHREMLSEAARQAVAKRS